MDDLCALEDSPWQTINKGERLSPDQLSRRLRDYSVKRTNLRLTPGVREQTKGYPIAPLADAWRRYLSLIPRDAVPPVTPVTKPALESYFEIALGTEGTGVTLRQEAREGSPQPDAPRVKQLAKWWRKRMRQLLGRVKSGTGRGASQEGITRNAGQRGAGHRPRYRGWSGSEGCKQGKGRRTDAIGRWDGQAI